jgi:hypothetical protein
LIKRVRSHGADLRLERSEAHASPDRTRLIHEIKFSLKEAPEEFEPIHPARFAAFTRHPEVRF